MNKHKCIQIHTHTHTHTHIYIYRYVNTHVSNYQYIYIYIYIREQTHIYESTHKTYIYICMNIYLCVYIFFSRKNPIFGHIRIINLFTSC